MRTTIPEKKLIYCDRCNKLISDTPDIELHISYADRDFHGDVVYGHSEYRDFCFRCSLELTKVINAFIGEEKP